MRFRLVVVFLVVIGGVIYFGLRPARETSAPEPPVAEVKEPHRPAAPTPSATPASVAAVVKATPFEAPKGSDVSVQKLAVLKEILDSHNDNDPRLDSDFRDLDAATKERLRAFYRDLPAEKLNSRGTVVFLLGRNLRSIEDARFFGSVLRQPPCLSLSHCSQAGPSDPESDHEVTLAYPQIVATVGLVKGWSGITDPSAKAELLQALQDSVRSPNPALARAARAALAELLR